MSKRELFEIIGSAITLGVSLWVAFGPLRHRLPRFLTRLAKYSVALKLLTLSGLCWWGFFANREYHGYHALRWGLLVLAIGLIGGALYVLTLKPQQAPKRGTTPPPPADGAAPVAGTLPRQDVTIPRAASVSSGGSSR